METESIIEQIKKLCFSQNLDEISSHNFMIDELANMLRNNSYDVVFQYPLNAYSAIDTRTEERVTKKGLIDLMAFKGNQTIAIEFDHKLHLKFKSIEKLLDSDAKTLIGIVKGRASPDLLEENKQRIISRMKELYVINKRILLIIMSEKTAVDISLEK